MSGHNVILDVQNLQTYFPIQGGVVRKTVGYVHAVEDVSFQIREQETFGLVGESGCGKSTTGRTILRLIEPTSGHIYFDGQDLCALDKESMRQKRRDMQLVFQDPYASLNPRMTVRKLLEEPLKTHFSLSQAGMDEQVLWISQAVGLSPEQLERYPHQFSGGQRQRLAIARALIKRAEVFIFDDSFSALDVRTDAALRDALLRSVTEPAKLIIAQRVSTILDADQILVLDQGRLTGRGTHQELLENCPAYREIVESQMQKKEA